MPIEISRLVDEIQPERTVLLFGAGSSTPSRAPSTSKIIGHLSSSFGIDSDTFSLGEIASLVERRTSRRRLIETVRQLFQGLVPTGGLVNIPLYDWKNIYTTNYDELIEEAYKIRLRDLSVYSSNFDFTIHETPESTKLFKLHGTIKKI